MHPARPGDQYTSAEYTKFMIGRKIIPSEGRIGSRYDNAVTDSFNAILKKELVNQKVDLTRQHATRNVTT